MDETPIKAGRTGRGAMKTGYFWPVYGEHDEVCFPFFPSRATQPVRTLLGLTPNSQTVLITDGYAGVSTLCEADTPHARPVLGAHTLRLL